MKNYSNLIEKIVSTYNQVLPQFGESKQQHFRSRLYKIYGTKNLLNSLQNDTFNEFYTSIFEQINGKRALDLKERYKLDSPIQRQANKALFIHKNIEFCQKFIEYLSILMKYNVIYRYKKDKDLDNEFKTKVNSILDKDFGYYFETVINNKDFLLNMPVQVINLLYWYSNIPNSKNIDIIECEKKLFESIKNFYSSELIKKDNLIFLNYLYTSTHIIIGKSWFYEYKVDSKDIEWIYIEFEKYDKEIFDSKEDDIIAEIGVCFALSKNPKIDRISRYQEYIVKNIDPVYNYLPSGKYPVGLFEDLNLSEHRNILTILLLSNMQHLYEFPE